MKNNQSCCYNCSLTGVSWSWSAASKHHSAMQQNAIYFHQLVFFAFQFITSCHFLYQIVGCYFWTPRLFEELNGQSHEQDAIFFNDLFMINGVKQKHVFSFVMWIRLYDKHVLMPTWWKPVNSIQISRIRHIFSLNSRWLCPSMALSSEGIPNTMHWSSCCGCSTASMKTSTPRYHPHVETTGSKPVERSVFT